MIKNNIILEDYLNYMETIRGRSPNTIRAYRYDLILFMRFMKKRYLQLDCPLDEIEIVDLGQEFIKRITLNDLYSYLSYVAKQRNNGQYARARKVACLKSFFKYLQNKAKLITE